MPDKYLHSLMSKLLLGKHSDRTNFYMDYAAFMPIPHLDKNGKLVNTPLGPNHRQIGHDPVSAMVIGMATGEGADVGLLHYALDMAFDPIVAAAQERVKGSPKPKADPVQQQTGEYLRNRKKGKAPPTIIDLLSVFLS